MPNNCVDLIFAHPPYANIIKYSKNIKEDISRLELNEFLNQMKLFSKECFRVLKKNIYMSKKVIYIFYKIKYQISI